MPLPIFLCNALPPTAPTAAPIAVAASSGGVEQADDEPDAHGSGGALLDRVVALFERDAAVEALAHDDCAPEALSATEDCLVVLVCGLGGQVATDEDIGRLVVDLHRALLAFPDHPDRACAAWPWCSAVCTSSSSCAERCGVMSNTTFFTVPVNANGFSFA